ncbi:hypothetical protein ABFX02_10G063000 [Erythranthe guttata]
MEIINSTNNKVDHKCSFSKAMPIKLIKSKVMGTVKKTKKIGEDDPRRIVHSVKVGLALTLASLFYYLRPLYDGFGQAGMWAILTVVVVFEFTVGGTLSKCINRGVATLLAGALGLGAEYLADLCGDKGEPIVLGLFVFLLDELYDYGVLIFILTFSLVAVSGYRVTQILQLAHQRLSTILMGGAMCVIISIFVCPVWAGQDLHNLVAGNIGKLATFLEGFGGESFTSQGDDGDKDKLFLHVHKSVLNSKATEESLANLAQWEPCHGRFIFRHPWKQYLKIGTFSRECASAPSEIELQIQPAFRKLSTESSKALKELASAIKNMTFPSSAVIENHLNNSKSAAEDLKTMLDNFSLSPNGKPDIQEIMTLLVIASLLTDIINCVEKISISVNELSEKARFRKENSTDNKQQRLIHCGVVNPVDDDERTVVIEIKETTLGDLILKDKH